MKPGWKRELAVVLIVGLPFIFWGMGSVSLLDPDEGLYGSIALEMAQSGDWITTRFNGLRYLEKPPLYFWLTAVTIKLFGASEWAVRLWSALPTLGTALVTWRMGRLLYGGQAGLLSSIVFLTGVGVFRYSRVAATDSLLVFSLTLSVFGLVSAVLHPYSRDRSSRLGPLLFFLGMGLGVLSKGLVGIVFPVAILGCFLFFSGERTAGSPVHLKWGLLLFLAVILPWHLLASWENPEFFGFYVLDNQVLRFLSQRAYLEDDVPVAAVAFLILTFLWFFPWGMFLSGTLRQGFPNLGSAGGPVERTRLVVGLWAVVVLGFFALSSLTLEHYFLPAIPPLSLMVGALWSEAFKEGADRSRLRWSLLGAALGCVPVGFYLLNLSQKLAPQDIFTWLADMNVYYRVLREQGMDFPFPSAAPFVPLAQGLALVLIAGVPLSLLLFYLGKPRASFFSVVCIAAAVAGMVFRLVTIIEPHHSAREVALAVKAVAGPADLIVHEGSLEYSGSLPFYTGRQIHVLNGKRGDLEFGSRYSEGQGLFLDDAELARLWEGAKRIFLIGRLPGTQSARTTLAGKPVFLLGRYGSRLLYSNHGP